MSRMIITDRSPEPTAGRAHVEILTFFQEGYVVNTKPTLLKIHDRKAYRESWVPVGETPEEAVYNAALDHCEEITSDLLTRRRQFRLPDGVYHIVNDRVVPYMPPEITPGEWRCPTCTFVLHRRVLFAQSGTVGIPTNEYTEPCPNCTTLLVPVTWQEEAHTLASRCEQLLLENKALREQLGHAH